MIHEPFKESVSKVIQRMSTSALRGILAEGLQVACYLCV